MKKKITLFLAVVSFLSLTGCDKSQEQPNETETAKEHITFETETLEQLSGLSACHNLVSYEDGPETKFSTYPLYYQQDFPNTAFENSTVAVSGSLITCVAMIESFYKSAYISPDILLNNYPELVSCNSEDIMDKIAEENNLLVKEQPFDIYDLADYLVTEKWPVILEIPHASAFGKGTSYILLVGTTAEGNLIVRDPNEDNKGFQISNNYGETIYTATSVIVEAGENSIMHTFMYEGKE